MTTWNLDQPTINAIRSYANGRQWKVDESGDLKVDGNIVQPSDIAQWLLQSYATAKRQGKMNGGFTATVNDTSIPVWTDPDSRSALTAAVVAAQLNPSFSAGWKGSDGTFYPLDAAGIASLAQQVADYVNGLFTKEATALAQIGSGAITSQSQIDAIFA